MHAEVWLLWETPMGTKQDVRIGTVEGCRKIDLLGKARELVRKSEASQEEYPDAVKLIELRGDGIGDPRTFFP
ncbi:MAG: hypothetical protein ACE5JP_08895 [Candidatus Bipolaricaulia bacterium]